MRSLFVNGVEGTQVVRMFRLYGDGEVLNLKNVAFVECAIVSHYSALHIVNLMRGAWQRAHWAELVTTPCTPLLLLVVIGACRDVELINVGGTRIIPVGVKISP